MLFANEPMPRRSIAPGKDVGLSVMLNVEKNEYYCTGTESVGFKVPIPTLGVKIRNMKMDLNIYGTWLRVGQ